jgi:hypothetical protein
MPTNERDREVWIVSGVQEKVSLKPMSMRNCYALLIRIGLQSQHIRVFLSGIGHTWLDFREPQWRGSRDDPIAPT